MIFFISRKEFIRIQTLNSWRFNPKIKFLKTSFDFSDIIFLFFIRAIRNKFTISNVELDRTQTSHLPKNIFLSLQAGKFHTNKRFTRRCACACEPCTSAQVTNQKFSMLYLLGNNPRAASLPSLVTTPLSSLRLQREGETNAKWKETMCQREKHLRTRKII